MNWCDKLSPNVLSILANHHAITSVFFSISSSLLFAIALPTLTPTFKSMFNQMPPQNAFKVFHVLVSLIFDEAPKNVIIGCNC
jgi:hypothetical protein